MIQINNVGINSIASTVPKNIIDNRKISTNSKLINSIGVNTRHIVTNNMTTMDLCISSAQDIFKHNHIDKLSIDALIFISQTPEYQLPATACIAQNILGLREDIIAYDVNLGCSGYTHGLFLASTLINSGLNNILLLVGDAVSRTINKDDTSTNLLFGDAGSATIVSKKEGKNLSFVLGNDGSGFEAIIIDNKKTNKTNFINDYLTMNGGEVFTFTLKRIPKLIDNSLQFAQLDKQDISHYIFHQANLFIIKTLAKTIGIAFDKFPISIDKYGNTSSASIPLTICHKKDIIKQNPVNILMAGFGVGLSWSSVIADLSNTMILAVKEI